MSLEGKGRERFDTGRRGEGSVARGRDGSDGVTSQVMPAATVNRKRQGTGSPLEHPEGAWNCRHGDFCPGMLILSSGLQICVRINFCSFKYYTKVATKQP